MKRFLIISICFLFVACVSYPKKHNFEEIETQSILQNPYFSDANKDYVYKATITVYDKVFGGIFIVKKIETDHHRVVFTTEMGNKILDFSFNKNDFQINYILEALNKKLLINLLKKDFEVLITEHLNVRTSFSNHTETVNQTLIDKDDYFYFGDLIINKIVRANHGKEKVVFTFSEINDNIAQQIQIQHLNIKFKMLLKSIN
ncbi:hypothetical protein Q4566_00195 [Tamlana sp. 2_MG-2023]|uniref:hypothetical protein n=1 Tax=unclassified Tamlana TaxID=2614803 RepID=UPI0026E1BCC2|nr:MULTISPECIES: hypothetical protein [unclassified Tamlana]MDO6758601.1 hypothetical protein [Tamlana sp. 2_MG-2023]MDO6789300.1 hypothetical protein [Tamlana sp. 1_MG-2023]